MKNGELFRLAGLALLLACGLMMILPCPTWAKSNAFLSISGIKGESNDKDHKDWIIIESLSWGLTKTRAAPGSSVSVAAARGHGDLIITKKVDSSSPKLMEFLTRGSNLREATIEFKRTDGKPGYMSYLLKNVKIVTRTLSPDGKTETMKLAYESAQASRS